MFKHLVHRERYKHRYGEHSGFQKLFRFVNSV